jgi:hypothetical protein
MAHAYVTGAQSVPGISAMVKHFAGFGVTEQGLNTGPAHGGERELRTTFLHACTSHPWFLFPFRACPKRILAPETTCSLPKESPDYPSSRWLTETVGQINVRSSTATSTAS